MNPVRPRLVLLRDSHTLTEQQLHALRSTFDVVEAQSPEDAAEAVRAGGLLLTEAMNLDGVSRNISDAASSLADALVQHVGEGVGTVNAEGELIWADRRLMRMGKRAKERFVSICRDAIQSYNQTPNAGRRMRRLPSRKFTFSGGKSHYEVVVSPDAPDPLRRSRIGSVVGVIWEITESRELQRKISAIDRAGSELMRIEASAIRKLNMAERLKLLEDKIIRFVHELLNFDNFEVRLLDEQTNRLELVIAVGITPLKIGEVMHATETGNGISGYVAATGQSYVCPDVRADPLYREGLDNAGSSLTVPLRLHDRVVGVFNIESSSTDAFDENDRLFAEIFGRYIAMAMNILDLMVVERYTTNEQIAENVLAELAEPLEELSANAEALQDEKLDADAARRLRRILRAARTIRKRVRRCTAGPRTILGAEQELRRQDRDPLMVGKKVLVADNDEEIRDELCAILRQRGCKVTSCDSGLQTIEAIESSLAENEPYDLIVSDIKMPDRTGYEVFRTARSISDGTPVILMTGFGYDPHHSIVRASQEGLHSLLFKPFRAQQLIEAVTKALKGRVNGRQVGPDEGPHLT